MFKKVLENKEYFIYILHSIYFNFKMLPFRQAVKLPFLLVKPQFISLKGNIVLDDSVCTFGNIKLGNWAVKAFPNEGIKLNMLGGTWRIHGKIWIGSNSSIEIGKNGVLDIENDFLASTGFKLFCYRNVSIGAHARFGWNTIVMDTNFHPLKSVISGEKKKAGAPIHIENNCWFGSECVVMPGVKTSHHSIFGMRTIVTRNVEQESYAVYAGNPPKVVTHGVYRDVDDDKDEAVYGNDFN